MPSRAARQRGTPDVYKRQGQTLPAGALCTVTFTAKADVTEQTAQFVAEQESIMLKDFTMPDNGKVENGTISVTVKPEEVKAYTASLTPATQSVTCGDNANVTVNVGATGYTNFKDVYKRQDRQSGRWSCVDRQLLQCGRCDESCNGHG